MTNPESPIYDQSEPRVNEGLTKREMFAAMAMQSNITHPGDCESVGEAAKRLGIPVSEYKANTHWPMIVAQDAVLFADALITELNKESK